MPTPGSTVAQLRGAFVGGVSAAVSIAAHAVGGGTVTPGQSSIALLLAGCTVTGVFAGRASSRFGLMRVMALLAGGQALGHTALTLAPGHQHSTGGAAAMLAAHLIAIPVGALLIHAAERALVCVVSRLRRSFHVLRTLAPTPCSPVVVLLESNLPAPHELFLGRGLGTRGPPPVHA